MASAAKAIGFAGLGGIILWSGVTNAGIMNSLQTIFQGKRPQPGQPMASFFATATGSAQMDSGGLTGVGTVGSLGALGPQGNGTGTGASIAQDALKYDGGVYWWGGTIPSTVGGNGVDCYGLLTYVLHHDFGYNLPNNSHSGYLEFLAWNGAVSIDPKNIQAGDLLIWPSHSGIAISSTQMISAMNPRRGVGVDTFQGGGPLVPEPLTVLRVTGSGGVKPWQTRALS